MLDEDCVGFEYRGWIWCGAKLVAVVGLNGLVSVARVAEVEVTNVEAVVYKLEPFALGVFPVHLVIFLEECISVGVGLGISGKI